MKAQNGFTPILLLLVLGGSFAIAIAGYSFLHTKVPSILTISATPTLSPSPILTPTPTPKKMLIPTIRSLSPTSSLPSITFLIKDNNGSPISDTSLALSIKNEDTGQEQKIQNKSSSWYITNLNPGKYKFWISYPTNRYVTMEKSCEGCENKEDVTAYDSCGYHFQFQTGNHVKISCTILASHPLHSLPVNSNDYNPGPDTMPPNTNIYYPQNNRSITYKIDGKVCAIATEPNDDQGPNGIQTEYKFDDGSWSGYAGGRGYLCADSLPNGVHTLSYHSKDKTGNVEATKTITFTVNIPGN